MFYIIYHIFYKITSSTTSTRIVLIIVILLTSLAASLDPYFSSELAVISLATLVILYHIFSYIM